jgi:hypothetical protein
LISTVFDICDKDQFALLQLIDEVPKLREAAQAVSFDKLIHQSTQTYFELHDPEAGETVICQKANLSPRSSKFETELGPRG